MKMREMETIMNVVVVVISLGLVTSTSANTGMTQKKSCDILRDRSCYTELMLIDVSILGSHCT